MNFLKQVMQSFDDKALGLLGAVLNENEPKIRSGVEAAVPKVLDAMVNVSSVDEGREMLWRELRDTDASVGGSFEKHLYYNNSQELAHTGQGQLDGLLGVEANQLINAVSRESDLGSTSARRLVGVVTPLVFASVANHQQARQLDQNALGEVISQQKQHLDQWGQHKQNYLANMKGEESNPLFDSVSGWSGGDGASQATDGVVRYKGGIGSVNPYATNSGGSSNLDASNEPANPNNANLSSSGFVSGGTGDYQPNSLQGSDGSYPQGTGSDGNARGNDNDPSGGGQGNPSDSSSGSLKAGIAAAAAGAGVAAAGVAASTFGSGDGSAEADANTTGRDGHEGVANDANVGVANTYDSASPVAGFASTTNDADAGTANPNSANSNLASSNYTSSSYTNDPQAAGSSTTSTVAGGSKDPSDGKYTVDDNGKRLWVPESAQVDGEGESLKYQTAGADANSGSSRWSNWLWLPLLLLCGVLAYFATFFEGGEGGTKGEAGVAMVAGDGTTEGESDGEDADGADANAAAADDGDANTGADADGADTDNTDGNSGSGVVIEPNGDKGQDSGSTGAMNNTNGDGDESSASGDADAPPIEQPNSGEKSGEGDKDTAAEKDVQGAGDDKEAAESNSKKGSEAATAGLDAAAAGAGLDVADLDADEQVEELLLKMETTLQKVKDSASAKAAKVSLSETTKELETLLSDRDQWEDEIEILVDFQLEEGKKMLAEKRRSVFASSAAKKELGGTVDKLQKLLKTPVAEK